MKQLRYINRYFNNHFVRVLLIFIIWRSLLFAVTFLGTYILPTFGEKFPYLYMLKNSHLPTWIWSYANFDGVHYLRIAEGGYTSQFTQVFFPLYPLLIRTFSEIFFHNLVLASLFISNLFFVFGLYFFSKLILLDFKNSVLNWSILFLLIFPTSFFFGSSYTESLFFFLVVCSFYFARSGNFLIASILGGFASATRLFGLLLIPALIMEYYLQNRHKLKSFKSTIPSLSIAFVPVGFLLYVIYLWNQFGDPLLFWKAQESLGTQRTFGLVFPLQVFYRYIKILTSININSMAFFTAIFELFLTSFAAVVLLFNVKRLRPSYFTFASLAILLPTFSGTLTSMPRYILDAIFISVCLAMIQNKTVKILIGAVFAILLLASTIVFTRGYWLS